MPCGACYTCAHNVAIVMFVLFKSAFGYSLSYTVYIFKYVCAVDKMSSSYFVSRAAPRGLGGPGQIRTKRWAPQNGLCEGGGLGACPQEILRFCML